MRAKQFTKKVFEAVGDGDVANAVVAEVIKLIGEGHTEVSPDVITTKVSAALGRPFMLKDLVAANNNSPELQHYIDSINPSKIKFSTDILTVKNQDPVKTKEKAEAGVASMASRAASRPRLGESVTEGWGGSGDRVHLPSEPDNYYHGKGQLSKEYNELYNKLVPSMGAADTIEGEVLRAASKIVYRHYNDGDEFNAASFSQLEPYIGKVKSYDDLAHKATVFALAAEGEYHPNQGWDSLDVMEYGPEFDDDDYDDEDEYWEEPEEEEDDDDVDEAANPAQQAAIAIAMKKAGKKPKNEGWESGPEERSSRERDPDADYDAYRQEKADAAAQAAQAARPQTKVYTLTGRGPNMEPNYQFPGEYDSQEEADAARTRLMADPKTPNPRMIGISTRTKYTENSVTPLRDLEDYHAKKKALQDIQIDPDTAKDPELNLAVMRRLAGLEKQRSELK